MKKYLIFPLIFFLTGCFSSGGYSPKDPEDPPIDPPSGDQGYLEIFRTTSGYFDTDYLFVSENGYQFNARGKTKDGKDASYTYSATWESSDTEVVVISNTGIAKALKDGTAIISATYGDYHDEMEVTVVTYASLHALGEVEEEYRTTKAYDSPIIVSPENAFIKYTFSLENAVTVLDNRQLRIDKAGTIEVTAKVYINDLGKSKEYNFTINAIDNNTPYFKYKDEVVKLLSLDIPVNKYQTLDVSELGISAYKGDNDEEITSSITVKEGTYKLDEIGEYQVTLSATNNEVEGTLPLTLNVIERETVITKVGPINLTHSIISYGVASTLKYVSFTMKATIPEGHEEYMGEIGFYVQFEAKKNVSGQKVTLDKYETKYFNTTKDRVMSISFQVYPSGNIDLRQGNENITILRTFAEFRGYGYDYIYY